MTGELVNLTAAAARFGEAGQLQRVQNLVFGHPSGFMICLARRQWHGWSWWHGWDGWHGSGGAFESNAPCKAALLLRACSDYCIHCAEVRWNGWHGRHGWHGRYGRPAPTTVRTAEGRRSAPRHNEKHVELEQVQTSELLVIRHDMPQLLSPGSSRSRSPSCADPRVCQMTALSNFDPFAVCVIM